MILPSSDEAELGTSSDPLPPNLTFQAYVGKGKGVSKQPQRPGLVIHQSPPDPHTPFIVPLSDLSSLHPTQSATSGETISLPRSVFGVPLRRDILHRCVVWFLSTLRKGNQSTKTRSTVAYSGRKLRPQKGSGRARVGDASSGTRRGGAPIFALQPRDHAQLLNRKIRVLGMRVALSSKLKTGLLRVVGDLNEGGWLGTREAELALSDSVEWVPVEPSPPTSTGDVSKSEDGAEEMEEARVTERFGPRKELSILFVHHGQTKQVATFERAVRNLPGVEVMSIDDVQVYHIIKFKWLIMDKAAVDDVVSRLGGETAIQGLVGDESDVEGLQTVTQ
ncbi:hypothetical protein TREMEDRAFT_71627 [Tremella mesenterica DSM 1558]|uniref:uncharacterized protein n=1 Tax=Tremella mesenterica (strain ATCC 24925 / CBS 8224 / DSM 1558 / NBRC 9311 / NRRL Y-6157 / RJB 2259-6 / UBC 559-6) TaxID=578456 RepID=UPI0003F494CB|nr:uncharacterized protein TREMEDRAFT_71627 [Tremella mesenterica DSM 1558]EIW69443.1 hypothetical protein TREMEDRAFT_71627 [Tremella mesenterica DSM 1558]